VIREISHSVTEVTNPDPSTAYDCPGPEAVPIVNRITLFSYDVERQSCPVCADETFHFVPIGSSPETARCLCGLEKEPVDFTDTAVHRLVNDTGRIRIKTSK
jgi:hypothetical protein